MGKEAKILAVSSQKGGVGKTTINIFIAAKLASEGNRVLILDCDSQASAKDWFEGEKELHPEKRIPLLEVEDITPKRVQGFLKRFATDYDFIFIDLPRITKEADNAAEMLLYYCSGVLVPVVGSQMDVLSTIDYLQVLAEVKQGQKDDGFKFEYFGFINRRNRRKDNEEAERVMNENGLKMFDNSLNDLKLFTAPSFYSPITSTREGKERFEPFYKEFKAKFKIK